MVSSVAAPGLASASVVASVLVAGLAASGCGPRSLAVTPPAPRPQPRLVVMIVVDQLPSWTFGPRAPSFTGGLRRLLDGGIYVPKIELPYGTPYTAPGHATLATGAPPAVHGIIGNSWYRRAPEVGTRPTKPAPGSATPHAFQAAGQPVVEAMVDADFDASAPIFRVAPEPGQSPVLEGGVSAIALRAPGLSEALHLGTGGRGLSVAVGLKARAACFVAGQRPDDVVFFEADAGGMTTSAAYAPRLPAWLVELARTSPVSRWLTAEWRPLDAARLGSVTGIADAAAGEGAEHNLGVAFPHRLADTTSPGQAISSTPYGDRLVLEAARAAVVARQLGADDVPDLLAVSLNSHDFAGHSWGPGSWEEVDLLWRLDAELGAFLSFLDERVGKAGYAVVLTSDHGATPLVERSLDPEARRIPPVEITEAAEAAFDAAVGPGEWIASFASSNLYLSAAARALPAASRERALEATRQAIAAVRGIAAVGRYEPIITGVPGQCERGSALDRAMCLAAAPSARGELYVVAKTGSVISPYVTGTHHDAPSDHNRQVPLLVMAPGVSPRLETRPLTTLSVAPTVAALLGVAPPAEAHAPPLELVAPPR